MSSGGREKESPKERANCIFKKVKRAYVCSCALYIQAHNHWTSFKKQIAHKRTSTLALLTSITLSATYIFYTCTVSYSICNVPMQTFSRHKGQTNCTGSSKLANLLALQQSDVGKTSEWAVLCLLGNMTNCVVFVLWTSREDKGEAGEKQLLIAAVTFWKK